MESKNVKHEDENIPELKPLQDPTTKDTPKIHGLNFAYCSTGLKEANNEPAHRRGRKRKDTDDVRTKGNLSGVETMLQELTMKDETAADGLKTGKEKEIQRKGKEVDNTDKGTTIEVGSSSRVTRSKSHSVIVLDTPDRNKKDSNMMDGQSTAGSRKSLRLRSVPHEQKTQEREEQNARMEFDSPGKRVEVDQNTPALWVWNIGLLKKRESTEIKRGGFGLLPLKNKVVRDGKIGISSTFGDKEDCQTTNEWTTKEEYVTSIKEKLNGITKLRKEAENELAVAMSKFGCNEEFTSVKAEIDMMFGNQKLTAVSTPMNTPLKPVKQDVPTPCTAIVLSQNIVDPFDKLWESPTYVVEVTESLRVSVENSKIKKSLADIAPQELRFGKSASGEAMNSDQRNGKGKLIDSKEGYDGPSFDLGISPIKDATPVRIIRPLDDSPIPIANKEKAKCVVPKKEVDEQQPDNEALRGRAARRTVRPGDHLKSPYYNRVVDFTVTAEDKRVHEWALSMFGCKFDNVFSTSDSSNIFRTGLESLAAEHMNTSPSVVNGWASILNYEERYRNRDSLRRHFFTIDVMGDPLLRVRSNDMNTQYGIFRERLFFASKRNESVINMKDSDLKDAMSKEVGRFSSMDADIKSQMLRQARDSRFERINV
ncbi:hypothetical protein L6452_42849 [Arctium lappa]|uniref:Uncharacterized protein n=1 Tax=Arctium lappa TaxID=4217 RepID=A0ACB8XJS4_ARCLA|nr:hypothetical protein L6452_42849 [Arctium lappa]